MVSWLTRIIGSSGNSWRKRTAISSGDHHSLSHPSTCLRKRGQVAQLGRLWSPSSLLRPQLA